MSSAKAALESDTRVSLHFFSTYAFLIITCHLFLASLIFFFFVNMLIHSGACF